MVGGVDIWKIHGNGTEWSRGLWLNGIQRCWFVVSDWLDLDRASVVGSKYSHLIAAAYFASLLTYLSA